MNSVNPMSVKVMHDCSYIRILIRDFTVFQAFVHPRFQFSPAADRYDVAVLRLERPVRYAPHITPICLPEAGRDPSPGTHAYVAGWGALIPGASATTKQFPSFSVWFSKFEKEF